MLSALLGAICAASMAFAPMLVEPSSNISNNDGEFTSVHGAYYDASSVSNYGNTASTFYNYTSYNFALEGGGSVSADASIQCHSNEGEDDDGNIFYYLYLGDGNTGGVPQVVADAYPVEIDVYFSGVYNATYTVQTADDYIFFLCADGFSGYVWAFDHSDAPAYELGTDTVADIAEGLTDGIGTVASGIGGGLQSLVRNIFLVGTYDGEGNFTATGLSTFGIVTIVMASLALALGLSRWVVGWASSLGERNR